MVKGRKLWVQKRIATVRKECGHLFCEGTYLVHVAIMNDNNNFGNYCVIIPLGCLSTEES